jgi:hypothetical protein
MQADKLAATEIQATIDRLYKRINDRFPEAGLARVCLRLHEVSLEVDQTVRWIGEFVQDFHDPVATEAVNDLESLTTGLSRKIWQKIVILRNQPV